MLQFQRRFNNLIDDLVKAETHHQFILAHEITIRIHQLGFELTQTKKPIYEWVGIYSGVVDARSILWGHRWWSGVTAAILISMIVRWEVLEWCRN